MEPKFILFSFLLFFLATSLNCSKSDEIKADGLSISGIVLGECDSSPVSGVEIYLWSAGGVLFPSPVFTTKSVFTDENGKFEFRSEHNKGTLTFKPPDQLSYDIGVLDEGGSIMQAPKYSEYSFHISNNLKNTIVSLNCYGTIVVEIQPKTPFESNDSFGVSIGSTSSNWTPPHSDLPEFLRNSYCLPGPNEIRWWVERANETRFEDEVIVEVNAHQRTDLVIEL